MTRVPRSFLIMFLLVAVTTPAVAVGVRPVSTCPTPTAGEELRYSWKMRGVLAWLARLRFPTSGSGTLQTRLNEDKDISSELKISSTENAGDFYVYQSEIDPASGKTLVTYHGYSFSGRNRNERTEFDYDTRRAMIEKRDTEKGSRVEKKSKPMPPGDLRDVVTAIYYLRTRADKIDKQMRSSVYSDGKLYPVLFTPEGKKTYEHDGKKVSALVFRISATPEMAKKWPGDVVVWLSNDAERYPLRIEMQKSYASLQLDLESVRSCEVMASHTE